MNYFITGTGTNVGKTIVSAFLCLNQKKYYWKPVQTGIGSDTDSSFMRTLIGDEFVFSEAYQFRAPEAPSVAAFMERKMINLSYIKECFQKINRPVIVEGAGGLMVPLTQELLMIDLIKELSLSTILVVKSELGMMNHTLLSLEALRKRNISIAGIIFVGSPKKLVLKTLLSLIDVPVIGVIPYLEDLSPNSIIDQARDLKFNLEN